MICFDTVKKRYVFIQLKHKIRYYIIKYQNYLILCGDNDIIVLKIRV